MSGPLRQDEAFQDRDRNRDGHRLFSRGDAFGSVVWTVAQNDPAIAPQMLAHLSGDAQMQTAVSIMMQWAKIDPEAASVWAISLPEGEWRGRVFENLIKR